MASWITSSKVNFKPDSSHTATGWIVVYQDSSTTSNASVTITGHINLYSTKDPASWYGTFSSSSTNITSNKGTVTKSLPNKSFTTNRSTKQHNEQIGTFTITIPRGTVAQTATISVSSSITITSSDFSGKSASGTVTGSTTVSVPALQSYAVTYNNNNGTGTTQSQTKYYDVALSLNYTNPSLTDYSFIGWATSEANAKAGTYSGTYVKGYSYTSNAALTLYGTYALAYSKPIINNLSVERCAPDPDNVGQYLPDDEGTYAIVSFDWSVFTSNSPQYYGGSTYPYSSNAVDSCTVTVGSETATPTLTGTSGSETVVVGSGNFSTDTQYATTVEITDTQTATSPHTTTAGGALPTSSFPIDVNADGTAVAILRPAPDGQSGLFVGDVIEAHNLPGIIKMFAGTFAPTGWLLCNGDEVAIDDYPFLYDVIGDTYGTPSDSDHFVLPDFRGRVPVGSGTGTASGATNHALGQKSGAETHTLTVDQMPSHTHVQNQHRHSTNYYVSTGSGNQAAYTTTSNRTRTQVYTNYETPTNQNTGGGQAHNNMQPFIAVNYIISTGNVSRWADSAGLPIVRDVTVNGQSVVNNEIAQLSTGNLKRAWLANDKSTTSGTYTEVCHIELEAGVWVLNWGVRFAANATGQRVGNITTTSGDNSYDIAVPAHGGTTQIRTASILSPSQTTTYYLNAMQNSGSALNLSASGSGYGNFINAVRIV